MGHVFAKIRELLTQNETRTSKPTNLEVREQVITIPDVHIVTIPEENEDQNRRKVTEEFRFNLANGEAAGSSNWLRTQPNKRDSWIKHYCSSHKILLVGEGDFSFSACLAKAFGSATNMVATSLDSQNFLRKQYRHAMSNINYLVNNHFLNTFRFDRIIYNFPWAGFFTDCPRETALNSLYHEVEQLRERLITIPDDTPYISSATTDETVEQISVPISDDAYTAVTIVEEHYDESQQIIHNLGGTSIDIAEEIQIVFTVSEPAKENVFNSKECHETTQDSASSSGVLKWVDIVVPKDICAAQPKKKDKWIKHYCSSHKILLVGEGDFSFSACLAQAFGSATNMVATSLDSKNFLKKNYKCAMSNINELKNKGCKVMHNMDATEMANNPLIIGMKFDRIVYNFPLAGFFKGYSRKNQLKFNRNLTRLFMKNAKEMLEEDGEIHITHKSYGFYLEWDLEKLARRNGLGLIEDVEFKLSDYPGYNNKYGFGGDDNFDCYGSRTYKFCIS